MTLEINNCSYEVIIEKKNNKNLYIRITDDLKIKVTCSFFYTKNAILNVLKQNERSIIRMIEKQKQRINIKKEEDHIYLGRKLNVSYENVRTPKITDDRIVVRDDTMLNNWYKKQAKEVFRKYLDEAYYVFDEDIPYPKIKVRSMKTRWGVCNKRDNSVTLNLDLIKKDHKYLNYVIVHELSHFVYFNHSKSFWNTVEKYCPEYKKVRKELKE